MTKKTHISKSNQEDIFQVPTGYFENFDQRLKEKISPETKESLTSKYNLIKPWIGLAASFLLISLIYNLIPKELFNPTKNYTYSLEEEIEIKMWTEESFEVHELIDFLALKKEQSKCDDIYPDSNFLGDLTHEDYVLLSHIEY